MGKHSSMVKRKKDKQTNNGPQNSIFDLCLDDVDLRHLIFMYANSYFTKDLRSTDPIKNRASNSVE